MLSVRCLSCPSVCNVRVLWPNGWTDQDETWHAGAGNSLTLTGLAAPDVEDGLEAQQTVSP